VLEELHAAVSERLRVDGQLYTASRRAVVEVLADADGPLTIPDVLARRALPQSSVYRNLAVLERANVVHRLAGTTDSAHYELTEDLTDHHHHHLICSSCGTVTDFTVGRALETALVNAAKKVTAETRFRVEQHRLDFVGQCGASRAARVQGPDSFPRDPDSPLPRHDVCTTASEAHCPPRTAKTHGSSSSSTSSPQST
jgi:Fur family ferric uptake transcriptional regulator